jgi:hypothetical protein
VALEDKDVLVVPLVSSGGVPGAPDMVVLAGALAAMKKTMQIGPARPQAACSAVSNPSTQELTNQET